MKNRAFYFLHRGLNDVIKASTTGLVNIMEFAKAANTSLRIAFPRWESVFIPITNISMSHALHNHSSNLVYVHINAQSQRYIDGKQKKCRSYVCARMNIRTRTHVLITMSRMYVIEQRESQIKIEASYSIRVCSQ